MGNGRSGPADEPRFGAYAMAAIPGVAGQVKSRKSGPADPDSAGRPRVRFLIDGKHDGAKDEENGYTQSEAAKILTAGKTLEFRNLWSAVKSYDDMSSGESFDFPVGEHVVKVTKS